MRERSRIKRFRPEEGGEMIGLPFQLIVISLVMAVVIPTVWGLSSIYHREHLEREVRNELVRLKTIIEDIDRGERGNRRVTDLDVGRYPFCRLEYIRVGTDSKGGDPEMNSMRYRIRGCQETSVDLDGIYLSNLSAGSLHALELPYNEDSFFLQKSDVKIDGRWVVEMGVIDEA